MQPNPLVPAARPQRKLDATTIRFAVIFFLIACAVFHISMARKGYSNYRDQHLGTALTYADGNIDLLRPIIVGFNAGNTPTPQEFPIWQASAAILFKTFGNWFGWANVTSLLFGLATLWPFYQLARTYSGERAGWWALLFYVSQPLVFYYNGRGGTDGSCLAFAVWFLYFADQLLRTRKFRWLLPSAILGALSATTKAPFFFCVGLASFFLLLLHGSRDTRRWGMLLLVGAVSMVAFAVWAHHTTATVSEAEFPLVDLRMSAAEDGGESMRFWFFGDWHYRLNPANWIKGGWRFLNAELGSFAFLGLMLWGAMFSKNRFGQLWFLAGLLTTLVFTHLVLHHHNYYLMFSPAVALLCGWAAERLESTLLKEWPGIGPSLAFTAIFTVTLSLSTIQGLIGMKIAGDTDPYPRRVARIVQEHTSASDKLLIQGGGWGGNILILSDRQGLSIWDTTFLEEPKNLARIRELGFTKLVMISESPMLLALQQSNPGQANQQRKLYGSQLSPVADLWRVLFQNDDLLIKEIPLTVDGN